MVPMSHMTGLEQRLLGRMRARGVRGPRPLAVGFSGGTDSLALLAALQRIAQRGHGPAVIAVHVDHGLRAESGRDADAAHALAERLGCRWLRADVTHDAIAGHEGVGVEEAARRERYRALAEVAIAANARAVVLAHHREDQAESVLLHLLRGAGGSGASGMAEWSARPIPWWQGEVHGPEMHIWRPLLHEPRVELERFITALGLEPIEDASNLSRAHTRNAIRLDVLPVLEHIVPGASAALARYADLAAADDAALDTMAATALAGSLDHARNLRWAGLSAAPLAVRRRAVKLWLLEAAPSAEPGMDRVEAVLAALERNRGGATVEIGNGESVVIRQGMATAGRAQEEESR